MQYTEELQDYINTVITRSASDIHLIVNSKPLFRVKRELTPFIQKEVLTEQDTLSFLALILKTDVKQAETEIRQRKHLLFSYRHKTMQDATVNFRVTAYLEQGNIAVAMRLIEETERTLEELNLPLILKNVMREPHGLFLVVGPAGNGKSTTLAAMVNHCNTTQRKHILTIEDPVEFIFHDKKSVITQREVPFDTPTFRSGLDSALRADADILMIGEMRETATMQAVMTAAEVGHLVLSTVHASHAHGVVHRIVDSFPPDHQQQIAYQLAESLLGICSIHLLPRTSGGLIPACEVLFNTNAVANLIREGRVASIKTVIETGREEGMISLEHSLADLVKRNEILLETARLYARDEQVLMKHL